jgi:hypothetical protein
MCVTQTASAAANSGINAVGDARKLLSIQYIKNVVGKPMASGAIQLLRELALVLTLAHHSGEQV